MYQRRVLSILSAVDFTKNYLGQKVITDTATIIECPGCGRNAIQKPTDNGMCYTHARSADGVVTEACMERPDGEAELVIWDADGELSYCGSVPSFDTVN